MSATLDTSTGRPWQRADMGPFEQLAAPLWVVDPAAAQIWWGNAAAARLWGLEPERLAGHSWDAEPEELRRLRVWAECGAAGAECRFELEGQRRRVRVSALRVDDGRAALLMEPAVPAPLVALFDHTDAGLARLDADGHLLQVSEALAGRFGRRAAELEGYPFAGLLDLEDRAAWEATLIAMAPDSPQPGRCAVRPHDGDGLPVALTLAPAGAERVLIAEDRERTELRLGLAKLAYAVRHSHSSVVITDAGGVIEYVNPRFTEITGYAAPEAIGRTPALVRHQETPDEVYQDLWRTIATGHEWHGELCNRRKDGSEYWSLMSISPVRDALGRVVHFVGVSDDVTELREARERAERLALYDPLTGTANRRLLCDRAEQALRGRERSDDALALLVVDLDRFKYVNDLLGHAGGDDLLIQIARRLEHCVRAEDTVARLGGDEFALLLPHLADAERASQVARKVIGQLAAPFRAGGREVTVSASIGIAVAPSDGDSAETLLTSAEVATDHARSAGGNQYRYFTAELNAAISERLALEQDLRRAVANGELVLHFQPQVELAGGRVTGVEALVRWQHPQRGLLPPDRFIPIAEESGLIVPIGEWVLETACKQIMELCAPHEEPLHVAVNISARQFREPGLVETVRHALDESTLPAANLELELTETTVMEHSEQAIARLQALKDLGVTLSVDDFGTGYSSLSYLKSFPIDVLKVDRSFLQDVATDHSDGAIAATIVALAHELGLKVVAEGVENDAQQRFLAANECDLYQGYLFSRPVPLAELAQLVQDWSACRPLAPDPGPS